MQAVASLSGVARCCVDPNALEWGHRLFLAVWGRGYAESCIRNKGKKKGRDSSFQSPGPLYSNSLLLGHAPFSQATALS
jgi:hypothetical protein